MRQNPLPAVVSSIAPDLRRFLDRVREILNDPKNFVTKEELADTGAFTSDAAGVLGAAPSGFIPGVTVTTDPASCISPPPPSDLGTSGAMTSIMLVWEGFNYGPCYSYTEVWRSDVEDIGTAILLGTTPAGIYVDAPGENATYYYWVRFVNIAGVSGAYNKTIGTLGETAPDVGYLIDQLSDAYGSTSEAPFFQIDQATTIGDVEIPAGTYMKSAYIYDAAITNAKIGNLAVDTANIALLAVETANIANLAVTNAQIEDLNATKINAGYIHSDRIEAGMITADHIGSTTIIAGNIVVSGTGAVTAATIGAGALFDNASNDVPADSKDGDRWAPVTGTNDATYVPGVVYLYDGTAWVDAAQSINDSVTVASNGSITGTTIDATVITPNSITASQIDANTITSTEINVSTLNVQDQNLTGTLTVSDDEGAVAWGKTTDRDFATGGLYIGNTESTNSSNSDNRFLLGNSTSFIIYDGTGISITGASVNEDDPVIQRNFYDTAGTYTYSINAQVDRLSFACSGGGGSAGDGDTDQDNEGAVGITGGDTTINVRKADGTLRHTILSADGGLGGATNRGGVQNSVGPTSIATGVDYYPRPSQPSNVYPGGGVATHYLLGTSGTSIGGEWIPVRSISITSYFEQGQSFNVYNSNSLLDTEITVLDTRFTGTSPRFTTQNNSTTSRTPSGVSAGGTAGHGSAQTRQRSSDGLGGWAGAYEQYTNTSTGGTQGGVVYYDVVSHTDYVEVIVGGAGPSAGTTVDTLNGAPGAPGGAVVIPWTTTDGGATYTIAPQN